MPEVAIIIPTRNRSNLLIERLRVLERHTPELHNNIAKVYIVCDEDDNETRFALKKNYPNFARYTSKPFEIPCNKWNIVAAGIDANWLVTMSDDSLPHDKWLTNALNLVTKGFIGLPDGITGNRNKLFTPLYMATKQWLRDFNGGVLVIPKYKCWYADMETCERAHRSGTYVLGVNSIVEQLHTNFGTAPDDDIYKLGASRRIADYKMFEKRKLEGFPNDFRSIL